MTVWLCIGVTYIRFYRGIVAQGIDRNEFAFKAPLQPYLTYYSVLMISLILFFANFSVFVNGNWDTADFLTTYLVSSNSWTERHTELCLTLAVSCF